MKFDLGIEVRDIVTGYVGTVVGRTEYLTGCNHYGLQAKVTKDGKVPDAEWFDESRLVPTGKGITGYKRPGASGPVPTPSGRR